MKSPMNVSDGNRARARVKQQEIETQTQALELAKDYGWKCVIQGKYTEAMKEGARVLKLAVELYGKSAIELVSIYYLLADANIAAGRTYQAEEFLALANWNIVKSMAPHHILRGELNRYYGKCYTAQEKFDDAIEQLAHSLYHLSLEYGPEDIRVSSGYYYLGCAFAKQNTHLKSGLAMFDKVVDIWYKYVTGIAQVQVQDRANKDETRSSSLLILKALEMFHKILDMRFRELGPSHIATGEAQYTMGLLFLHSGDAREAKIHVNAALEIYQEQLVRWNVWIEMRLKYEGIN